MALLPLYILKSTRPKIVIIGGGYAGLAALTTLRRYSADVEITLIDPGTHHLKITHLHETFRYPLSDLQVSYTLLEQRFDCRHIRSALTIDEAALCQWQERGCLQLKEEAVPFDYLLVATGARQNCLDGVSGDVAENVLVLEDFCTAAGSDLLDTFLEKQDSAASCISVIGGGATGIQFLFELAGFLHRRRVSHSLRLIDDKARVLQQFPPGFASYIEKRMLELDIEFFPGVYFLEQRNNQILLEEQASRRQFELPSMLSLVFTGNRQNNLIETNLFGQVKAGGKLLENVFAAGDGSVYPSLGSNSMTAQSAVRKGKLAARNMLRYSGLLKVLEPYLHRDLGYVVSLGPEDAVGWLVLENNVVTGVPVMVIKEAVETRYDLLLSGVDTYLV
ncbi:pyridine nucleotide-disulfide oxidoreductase [Nitrosomonas sp. HPC101]|uniref:NAD(P)/FAD-dependent oxidoreductase n=1 Tax=Nitrosomonas sp. HPC101 TaxID=1658667 RepID=UPI00136E2243|nr:FAD-dependent oxidoreductase [Nitrosomonas sp. HPC101]MXS85059.1 pyridine nucleotide-disulfide oxidoreductase [Nitrosomonas sp. HPC101]